MNAFPSIMGNKLYKVSIGPLHTTSVKQEKDDYQILGNYGKAVLTLTLENLSENAKKALRKISSKEGPFEFTDTPYEVSKDRLTRFEEHGNLTTCTLFLDIKGSKKFPTPRTQRDSTENSNEVLALSLGYALEKLVDIGIISDISQLKLVEKDRDTDAAIKILADASSEPGKKLHQAIAKARVRDIQFSPTGIKAKTMELKEKWRDFRSPPISPDREFLMRVAQKQFSGRVYLMPGTTGLIMAFYDEETSDNAKTRNSSLWHAIESVSETSQDSVVISADSPGIWLVPKKEYKNLGPEDLASAIASDLRLRYPHIENDLPPLDPFFTDTIGKGGTQTKGR